MRSLLIILICSISSFAPGMTYPDPTWSPEFRKVPGFEPVPAGLSKADIDRQISEYMENLNWSKVPVDDLSKKHYIVGPQGNPQIAKDEAKQKAQMYLNSVFHGVDEFDPPGSQSRARTMLVIFQNIEFMRAYRLVYGKIPSFHWQTPKQ